MNLEDRANELLEREPFVRGLFTSLDRRLGFAEIALKEHGTRIYSLEQRFDALFPALLGNNDGNI